MNKYLEKIAKSISLDPSHKGELHEDLGVAKSKRLTLSQLKRAKNSRSVAERKRATFAINARKWNHKREK